jgi:hypothetical protein
MIVLIAVSAGGEGTIPRLASTYTGTIHNTTHNREATLALTSIVENQGNIRGQVIIGPGLRGSGAFTGTINTDGSVNFEVKSIFFKGSLHTDGSFSGTYNAPRARQQGTWQTTAAIGEHTIPHGGAKKEILTNAEVIELTKLGLGDVTIIEKIRQSEYQFDTSIEALRQLKAAQVSDTVIREMINPQASARSSTYPATQPEGERPPGSGENPAHQHFFGAFTGKTVTTRFKEGSMSINIKPSDSGRQARVSMTAWDGPGQGKNLIGEISADGQLRASGEFEYCTLLGGCSTWKKCELTGVINGNRLTGNYKLTGGSGPGTVISMQEIQLGQRPLSDNQEGYFDLQK